MQVAIPRRGNTDNRGLDGRSSAEAGRPFTGRLSAPSDCFIANHSSVSFMGQVEREIGKHPLCHWTLFFARANRPPSRVICGTVMDTPCGRLAFVEFPIQLPKRPRVMRAQTLRHACSRAIITYACHSACRVCACRGLCVSVGTAYDQQGGHII